MKRAQSIVELFHADGPLFAGNPNAKTRPNQLAMVKAILTGLRTNKATLIEAQTGLGKTLAYLVPTLLTGRRVMVATATKALQQQLVEVELPKLSRLGKRIDVAVLKGVSNYVCLASLEYLRQHLGALTPEQQMHFALLERWVSQSHGELSDIGHPEVFDFANQFAKVGEGGCSKMACPHYQQCFYFQHRRRAERCNLILVNQHYLLSHADSEQLVSADILVVDEAHRLLDSALGFLWRFEPISPWRALKRYFQAKQFGLVVDDSLLATLKEIDEQAQIWFEQHQQLGVAQFCQALLASEWHLALKRWVAQSRRAFGGFIQLCQEEEFPQFVVLWAQQSEQSMLQWWHQFNQLMAKPDAIFALKSVGASWGMLLKEQTIEQYWQQTWAKLPSKKLFVSSSLTLHNRFEPFAKALNIKDFNAHQFESHFDYAKQSRLFMPRHLPPINHPNRPQGMAELIAELSGAARGRTLVLFNSHQSLNATLARLPPQLGLPVLYQGQAPAEQLLSRFKTLGNAILLATGAFWEGVDVQGRNLICVIIEKLPFRPPNEVNYLSATQAAQTNLFDDYLLPRAVITFKQGAGRLIRGENDRGLLVLCDDRVVTRDYGAAFMATIAPRPALFTLAEAKQYLSEL